MDAILVFDCNNYLIHSHLNSHFLDEIARISFTSGHFNFANISQVRLHLERNENELRNLIVLLLGPFVASLKILQNDCPHIELFGEKSNKIRIFYYEYLDYMFVYMSHVNNVISYSLMQRKLEIFVELCKMLFGVSLNQLDQDEKQRRLLNCMFSNWLRLRSRPAFLLESVERLVLNANLHQVFKDLLCKVTAKFNQFLEPLSEETVCEAFLFIDNKLICDYKTQNGPLILKSDLVLLQLLNNTVFCCQSDESFCESFRIDTKPEEDEDSDEGIEKENDSCELAEEITKEETYLIDEKTIDQNKCESLNTKQLSEQKLKDQQTEQSLRPSSRLSVLKAILSRNLTKTDKGKSQNSEETQPSGIFNSRTSLAPDSRPYCNRLLNLITLQDKYLFDECEQRLVYLRSSVQPCNLVPFYARIVRLTDSIGLLLLSELPSAFLSFHIHNLLTIINTVQYHPSELRCFHTVKQLTNSSSRVQTYAAKLAAQSTATKQVRRALVCQALGTCLSTLDSSDLRKHVLSVQQRTISSRLEAVCASTARQLRDTSEELIYEHHVKQLIRIEYDVITWLSQVKAQLLVQLQDYAEFLTVKSEHNVAIESYLQFIPQLVCFLYVDRGVNEFIYSSVQSDEFDFNSRDWKSCSNTSLCFYEYLIGQVITNSYLALTNGQLCFQWAETGFIHNYCIWFEDVSGNVLKFPKKQIKLSSFPNMTTNNFIQTLASNAFPCYKLASNLRNDSLSGKTFESTPVFTSGGSKTTANGAAKLVSNNLRRMLSTEMRCYELFYVQRADAKVENLVNYLNQLRNAHTIPERANSLMDANIIISKKFASKLNEILLFCPQK